MANTSKKSLDINGLEYVASKVMTLVNSGGTADYIVEEGTEGIWTYRKWATGIAECWGKNICTLANAQVWTSPIYSAQPERPNYPFTFLEPPTETAIVTNSTNACWLYKQAGENNKNTTTTTTNYWAIKVNAFDSTSIIEISYQVKGLWKEFTPSIMNTPSLDLYYPVGSIYQTSNANFDPNITFGGTWELITNKFLIGAGDEYELGETGGEATHVLTIDEMPTHRHEIGYRTNTNITTGTSGQWTVDPGTVQNYSNGTCIKDNGGGLAHNNLPPYKAVFMWERTA